MTDRSRRTQKADAPPPGASGPTQQLDQVAKQAQFQACTPRQLPILQASPVPCTAVVVACFRGDGNLLLLQEAGAGKLFYPAKATAPKKDDYMRPQTAEELNAPAAPAAAAPPTAGKKE